MPSENPQLLIVGGPNGAGKSSYSGGLSPKGAFVFDADIITARVKARLPADVPVESIYFAVQSVFLDFVGVYYGDVDHPVPGQIDHWVS